MELLSIIIPCFNEAKTIKENIQKVHDYMKTLLVAYEIIAVNDGSRDNTLDVLQTIKNIKVVTYPVNRGKGGAVKHGIEKATGDYIYIMDADLSTDLKAIEDALPLIRENQMVIGSRHCEGSEIVVKQPLHRQFIGLCCRIIVSTLFDLNVKDSQCGFKVFQRDFARFIISRQKIMRFAFDVEYLYIAKVNDIKFVEMPVKWTNDLSSTVSAGSAFSFFGELLQIFKNKKKYIKKAN